MISAPSGAGVSESYSTSQPRALSGSAVCARIAAVAVCNYCNTLPSLRSLLPLPRLHRRVGACLQEEISDFLFQHKAGELGYHQADAAINAANAPRACSTTQGRVLFGDQVMIINVGAAACLSSLPSVHTLVSETVDDSMVVTAAKFDTKEGPAPVQRNVFTVLPVNENDAIGTPVKFGTSAFRLEANHPLQGDTKLYLWSQKAHLNSSPSRISGEQKVCLKPATGLDSYCMSWGALFQDPEYRLETEGEDILANAPVVLKHLQSGLALSCNYQLQKKMLSEFGKEEEVSCGTKIGRTKVELPENQWTFSMPTSA